MDRRAVLALRDWPLAVGFFEDFANHSVAVCPFLPRLQFSTPDLFSSAIVCFGYRGRAAFPKSWIETLVACTMLQFGGTTLTGLILGQTPSWLSSNKAWPSLALLWWFTFCCPLDLWYRLMRNDLVRGVVAVFAWLSTAHSISTWGADKALGADHVRATRSVLCAVACGTVSACGGGICSQVFNIHQPRWNCMTGETPEWCVKPSFALQKSLACSVLYYFLLDPHDAVWTTGVSAVGGVALPLDNSDARTLVGLVMLLLSCTHNAFPNVSVLEVVTRPLLSLALVPKMVDPVVFPVIPALPEEKKQD